MSRTPHLKKGPHSALYKYYVQVYSYNINDYFALRFHTKESKTIQK